MSGHFLRFTPEAREALAVAQQHADTFQHGEIGSDHLLLALAQDPASTTGTILGRLNLTVDAIATQIGQQPHRPRYPDKHVDLSADLKRGLELAVDEAQRLGHTGIEAAHLLLGLMRLPDGPALQVLRALHLDPTSVYKEAAQALRNRPATPGQPSGAAQGCWARWRSWLTGRL